MAFVDTPHYQWVMGYLWGIKHFMVSLRTAEVLTPSHVPTLRSYYEATEHIDHWEAVFNGLNGPYMLLGLTFDNIAGGTPKGHWGNRVKITCDGGLAYEHDDIFDLDLTRYVGRDGEWAPFFFAQDSLLVETQPIWTGTNEPGRINCTIMRFAE